MLQGHFPAQWHDNKHLLSVTLGWKFLCLQFKPLCLGVLLFLPSQPLQLFRRMFGPSQMGLFIMLPIPMPSQLCSWSRPSLSPPPSLTPHRHRCINFSTRFLQHKLGGFINIWYLFLVLPYVERKWHSTCGPCSYYVTIPIYKPQARQVVPTMLPHLCAVILSTCWSQLLVCLLHHIFHIRATAFPT